MSAKRFPAPQPDEGTVAQQERAANPANNAWVSANAGSGKTYVLASRVIRLLLAGVQPESILCLTYTKAAAAQMKSRVFDRLAQWLPLDDRELSAAIEQVIGRRPDATERLRARTLFARALETPGGLKIQTIHAFCEAVLHRFPLEANVPAHFEMMDDASQAAVLDEARIDLLVNPEPEAKAAMQRLLAAFGDSRFDNIIKEITGSRLLMERVLQGIEGDEPALDILCAQFGLQPGQSRDAIVDEWNQFNFRTQPDWQGVHDFALAQDSKSAEILPGAIVAMSKANSAAEIEAVLRSVVLTSSGEFAKFGNRFPKVMKTAFPELAEDLPGFFDHMKSVVDQLAHFDELCATHDVLVIANALLTRYHRMKASRGLLDFGDLIARTANLLSRADVGAWVRYKLDAGIDHLLVDEAQDTSRLQWAVIDALTNDFHDGEGAASAVRTIFVVGDEKQSIYSFQGARPEQFFEERARFGNDLQEIGQTLHRVPLAASFRSVAEVLEAVDIVFADETNAIGLGEAETRSLHRSLRNNQHGAVELWPVIEGEKAQRPENWHEPEAGGHDAAEALAQRIADTIERWLTRAEPVLAGGLPVRAGDIVILVRKRDSVPTAVTRALKKRGIPVAGADRLKMMSHIAVLDLLALARFLLEPEDDLSLAECLKSPIFGFDDDDLLALAHGRGDESLGARLHSAAGEPGAPERITKAVDQLAHWRTLAASNTAFGFFATIFARHGVREALVARLGAETPDVLDEFLAAAQSAQRDGAASLQQFVRRFETTEIEIKREQDQAGDQVRVMTVHGAKGLEAPVIFLIDQGSPPRIMSNGFIRPCPDDPDDAPRILVPAPSKPKSSVKAGIETRLNELEAAEYRRLLYVGMTRAADRLVVCGLRKTPRKTDPEPGVKETWHDMVWRTLCTQPQTRLMQTPEGPAFLFEHVGQAPESTGEFAEPPAAPDQVEPVPDWFIKPAPPEPPAPRPLAASSVGSLVVDVPPETGTMLGGSLLGASGSPVPPSRAAQRGTALHTLLQFLPDAPPATWQETATKWCQRALSDWTGEEHAALVAEALAVLEHPALTAPHVQSVRTEVAISATLRVAGEERAVSGVIDRLVVAPDGVTIIDYKSNQAVPGAIDALSQSHVAQMALYRAMVADLYPDRPVICVLIYTRGPVAFELPDDMLMAALAEREIVS